MVLLLETGRRFGLRRLRADSAAAPEGFSVVEGAVFDLMGLLIAFTFLGAAVRFDTRRELSLKVEREFLTSITRCVRLGIVFSMHLKESGHAMHCVTHAADLGGTGRS